MGYDLQLTVAKREAVMAKGCAGDWELEAAR